MMVPVYAAIFAIACQWFLPWLSMPILKYSKLAPTYTAGELGEWVENVQACIQMGGLPMEALSASQAALLTQIGSWLKIGAVVLSVLMVVCAVAVLVKKSASRPFVRVTFSVQLAYLLAQAGLWLWFNLALNEMAGRPSSFLNMTISSYVQLTSWDYAQAIIAVTVIVLARRLMDVNQETGPQKFVERTQQNDRRMGKRTIVSLILLVVAIPFVIFFGIFFLNDRANVFIGVCICFLSMLPFAMVFEDRRPQGRELLLIAVLSAIAVVGRAAFFMLPQFKPVTAIVIISGIGLGPEAGFLTGAMSGFVSNFFYGQGPWTPFQMFSYGIIGFIAGLVFNRRVTSKIRTKRQERVYMAALCTFGFLSAQFIYGLIMDFSSALTFTQEFSWEVLVAKIISGLPFNFIHAVSTVIFLLFLARPMQRKLDRIKKKYGIMEV